jgi:cyclopropane fatty-acyl-phospholipid synthase-like methyltransferase
LDHGSGAGRHVVFLAENGYQAYGADISSTGNAFTRKITKIRNLSVNVSLIDSNILKYADNFFDGIISFGVLYYLNSKQLDVVIPDLYRILKREGKMLVVLRSRRDYRFKHAKSIGHGDYIIVGDNKTRVNNEKNMLMHFFTEKEIRKRFHKFKRITIDEMVNTYNNKEMVDYDFVVELKK